MQKAILISGFPGIGKSTLHQHYSGPREIIDLDAYPFARIHQTGERHPKFPDNYIEALEPLLKRNAFILVSTHQQTRDALVARRWPFVLVTPNRHLKEEYLTRYQGREQPAYLTNYLIPRWNEFMDSFEGQPGCQHIILGAGEYLSDAINKIDLDFLKTLS